MFLLEPEQFRCRPISLAVVGNINHFNLWSQMMHCICYIYCHCGMYITTTIQYLICTNLKLYTVTLVAHDGLNVLFLCRQCLLWDTPGRLCHLFCKQDSPFGATSRASVLPHNAGNDTFTIHKFMVFIKKLTSEGFGCQVYWSCNSSTLCVFLVLWLVKIQPQLAKIRFSVYSTQVPQIATTNQLVIFPMKGCMYEGQRSTLRVLWAVCVKPR